MSLDLIKFMNIFVFIGKDDQSKFLKLNSILHSFDNKFFTSFALFKLILFGNPMKLRLFLKFEINLFNFSCSVNFR